MILNGLMKTTLLDFPGKLACTAFLGGCNLRCPFCHNGSLVLNPAEAEQIDEEAFFAFLDSRKGVLDGVCITGGEPTLRPDLLPFIARIKEKGLLVKLDTNGTRPEVLRHLLDEGVLDHVAMDIKSSREGYSRAVGIKNFDVTPIEQSAALLMEGAPSYEFRTTLVKSVHTEADIHGIGRWLRGDHSYFLQNFVDSGDLIDQSSVGFTPDEMQSLAAIARQYLPKAQVRGL